METKPNWELLTKYINNECNVDERGEFELWLDESNKNKLYFEEIKAAWDSYGTSQAPTAPNKQKAWQQLDELMNKPETKTRKLPVFALKIAASVLVLLTLAFLIKNFVFSDAAKQLISEVTTETQTKEVRLPDNTVVWINKNSELQYPETFSENERRVFLKGEAFFEVTKNAKQPFIIEAGGTCTKVIGTSFNIRAYENESEVQIAVNSGKVAFYPQKKESEKVYLTKGESGTFNNKAQQVAKVEKQDPNYQSWKTGKLLFLQTSFGNVCKALSKHYNKKIEITDSSLRQMVITATYNHQSFEEVVAVLAQTLEINYKLNKDGVVFSK